MSSGKNSHGPRKEWGIAALVLFLYGVIFYAPILFSREVWVFRDLYVMQLSVDYAHRLLAQLSYPPLWNPYFGMGKPFAADLQTAVFYPPAMIMRAIPMPLGFNANLALHHFIAGLGVLALLRLYGVKPFSALLGALAFSYGGYAAACDNYPNALQSIAWIPWTVWSCERWLASPRKTRFVCLSVFIGLLVLGGFPETLLMTDAILAVRIGAFGQKRSRPRLLLGLLGAHFAASLLFAFQFLPTLFYMMRSSRAETLTSDIILRFSLAPENLLGFLLPFRFLSTASDGILYSPFKAPLPWAISLYLGVGLLSALLAWRAVGRRAFLLALCLCVLASVLAFGFYLPGLRLLIDSAAVFRIVRYPEKLLLIPHFLLSLGVAFGVEGFCALGGRGKRRFCVGLLLGAVLAIVCGVLAPLNVHRSHDLMVLAALLGLLGGLSAVFARRPLLFSLSFLILYGADLALVNGKLLPAVAWGELTRAPEWFRRVPHSDRADLMRIYSNSARGLLSPASIHSYLQYRELMVEGASQFYNASNLVAGASINLHEYVALHSLLSELPRPRVVSLLASLGVKYITSPMPLPHPKLERFYSAANFPEIEVYRVTEAKPRAYLAPQVRCVDSPAAAMAALRQGQDPLQTVSLVAPPGDPVCSVGFQGGEAKVEHYLPNEVRVRVQANARSVLVLSDAFYPGWRVFVDGAEKSIMRANYFSRGVAVEGGTHEVVFRFMPLEQRIGYLLSLVTVLAGVVWLGSGKRSIG